MNAPARTALVVEGGAMRTIFAAGVLDAFLTQQHRPYDICYGVSAGTTALAAWIAGQHGRTRQVIMDLSCRPEFIDFARFVRGGDWLDFAANTTGAVLASLVACFVLKPRVMRKSTD